MENNLNWVRDYPTTTPTPSSPHLPTHCVHLDTVRKHFLGTLPVIFHILVTSSCIQNKLNINPTMLWSRAVQNMAHKTVPRVLFLLGEKLKRKRVKYCNYISNNCITYRFLIKICPIIWRTFISEKSF